MTESRPSTSTRNERRKRRASDRADPHAALIEQQAAHAWTVSLPDGDGTHRVVLIADNGVYLGRCTCDGFDFHEGPCAHLCTIRKADTIGCPDVNARPINIQRVNEIPKTISSTRLIGSKRDFL